MNEDNTDVSLGTLDMLILKTLSLQPLHGFGIARRIEQVSRGVFKVNPGSLLVALVALVSPVDALAYQLFFMHMVQHVLLLDVVPILAILGFTKVILRPLTRAVQRLEEGAGVIASPAFGDGVYRAGVRAGHRPGADDAAR